MDQMKLKDWTRLYDYWEKEMNQKKKKKGKIYRRTQEPASVRTESR